MNTNKTNTERKDLLTIAFIIVGILTLVALFSDSLPFTFKAMMVVSIITSFLVGNVGSTRKIGFAVSLLVALVFSPVIGFLVVFNSEKIADEEYREKMLAKAADISGAASPSLADELLKLNELRKEGILTEEEFTTQKERLLAQ